MTKNHASVEDEERSKLLSHLLNGSKNEVGRCIPKLYPNVCVVYLNVSKPPATKLTILILKVDVIMKKTSTRQTPIIIFTKKQMASIYLFSTCLFKILSHQIVVLFKNVITKSACV